MKGSRGPGLILVMAVGGSVLLGWPELGSSHEEHSGRTSRTWTFEEVPVGTLPKGFVVGSLFDGRPAGQWKVLDMRELPAFLDDQDPREQRRITKVLEGVSPPSPPQALGQVQASGFEHDYKVVLIEGTEAADLDLDVSFLAVAGKGDMGGGLIWRAQNDRNYYLTRANPLEQNIRFYRIVDGVRKKLANFDRIISVDAWHRLAVEVRGTRFKISYDGEPVLTVEDDTFSRGRVGLWMKADAVTYFDNLEFHRVR